MIALPLLLLAACAPDGDSRSGLPDPTTPPPGAPTLRVSEVVSGAQAWVELGDGAPGWTGLFWRGAPGASCPPYLQGQCLDIARPKVTRVSGLDGDGRATWSVGIPSGLAAGVGTRLQGAMHDHVDVVLTPSLDVEVAAGDVCGGAPAALSAPGFEQSTPSTWQLPAGYAWAAAPDEGANTLEITGNVAVEQWFPAVPVSALSQATFRAWHDGLDAPLMLVEWTYADGAVDLHAFQAPELAGWQTLDLLPLLDPSEKLVHVRVWGYESGVGLPDVTRLDAFALCR